MGVLRRRTWGEKEDQQQSDRAMDGLSFHAYESKIMGAKIGRALFAAIGMAVAACKVWPDTRQNPTFMYQAYFPGRGLHGPNKHSIGFAQ